MKNPIFCKFTIVLIISAMLFSIFSFSANASSGDTISSAVSIADDQTIETTLYGSSDQDWYVANFSASGIVNFYIGSIPSTSTYQITVYENSQASEFTATATNPTSKTNALIKWKVTANTNYYIKINSVGSAPNSSDKYKVRVKRYSLSETQSSANTFGFKRTSFGTDVGCLDAMNYIWAMGYSGNAYNNNYVSSAFSVLQTSGTFVVANTSAANYIEFSKSDNDITYLYASNSSPGTNNRSISSLAANALGDVKLALYVGSYTASGSSNLVTSTINKGAFCSVGFTSTIDYSLVNKWLPYFFYYCKYGNNVSDALQNAAEATANVTSVSEAKCFTYTSSQSSQSKALVLN